jgi:hypothetical protein
LNPGFLQREKRKESGEMATLEEDGVDAYGGLSSVLEVPPTPSQKRRVTNVDLREELAAATAAIKDQKWVKAFAQRVARFGDEDDDENDGGGESSGRDVSPVGERSRRSSLNGASRPTSPQAAEKAPSMPSVLVPQATDDILAALDPRFFTKGFDGGAYMLVRSYCKLLEVLPRGRRLLPLNLFL